jgi:uncharacterized protein (DUF952 family)
MSRLFHITDPAAWAEASSAGEYRMSTRGVTLAEEGFIHCSLEHQVPGVVAGLYADVGDLLLLVIDLTKVPAAVRFEPVDGGEAYPHVFGPLPVAAVTEVRRIRGDRRRVF